jgi:glyceraldehyde-3-phosphate dehydrogenase/erythrose-4-phosphate dehydrogenase
MAYFKINNIDYSTYVSGLTVTVNHSYNAQTNAAGNTVADYINSKRVIDVNIIPLDTEAMAALQTVINSFNVTVTFRNPQTQELEEINCIIPTDAVDY